MSTRFVVSPDFLNGIKPVRAYEIVKPTRVVWKASSGFLTSRIFPTEERAYAFAANLDEKAKPRVEDPVKVAPYSQPRRVNRGFNKIGRSM